MERWTMSRSGGFLSKGRPGLARNALVDFQYLRALGYAPYEGAAIGEVIRAAGEARRRGSGRDAVVEAWRAQGRHLRAEADSALEAGSPVGRDTATSGRTRLSKKIRRHE